MYIIDERAIVIQYHTSNLSAKTCVDILPEFCFCSPFASSDPVSRLFIHPPHSSFGHITIFKIILLCKQTKLSHGRPLGLPIDIFPLFPLQPNHHTGKTL